MKTFDVVLREAFVAGFESHVYDPSDRPVEERFARWRGGLVATEETSPMPPTLVESSTDVST